MEVFILICAVKRRMEIFMEEKTDLRVIKTKKALVETLMQSLREKPFEDITVQYLCDNAMVRRATFYTHFADKYELFSYTIRQQYQAFPSFQHPLAAESTEEMYRHMVKDAINFMAEHRDVFGSLLGSQMVHVILNIIRSEVEQDLLPLIEASMRTNDISDLSPKFIFNFHLHAIFGSFLWWVREDCPITKNELIAQIQSMIHIG